MTNEHGKMFTKIIAMLNFGIISQTNYENIE